MKDSISEELWDILHEYVYEYRNKKMVECRYDVAKVLENYINASIENILTPKERQYIDFDISAEKDVLIVFVLIKENTPIWMYEKLYRKMKKNPFDKIMKHIYQCYEEYNE